MSRRSIPAATTPTDRSWLIFAGCKLAVLAGMVLLLAGAMWPVVVYHLLVDGSIAVIWLVAAVGFGFAILRFVQVGPTFSYEPVLVSIERSSRDTGVSPVPAPFTRARRPCHIGDLSDTFAHPTKEATSKALIFTTAAGIGLGLMSLLVLALGLCGWMNRVVAIGVIVAGIIGIIPVMLKMRFARPVISGAQWLWLLIVLIIAMVLVAACVLPGVLWGDEPNGYDVTEYHLQVPREWFEAGRIMPLEHNAFSYFPFNVEMHYLLAMHLRGGPWAGMYLAQLMHACYIALTVVAVYGIVRMIAKPQAAIVAAIFIAMVPWTSMLAPVAYDEGGLLLYGTLAIGWTILAMRSQRPVKLMALAGAMAGFACGTKLTAVPMVLLAAPVCYLASSLCHQERFGVRVRGDSECAGTSVPPHPGPLLVGERIRCAGVFVVAGLLTFAPWLIRNTIWTGNPVFPEAMSLLGRGHFSEVQIQRWSKAHSVSENVSRIDETVKQLVVDWRFGGFVLPIALAATLLSWRRAETKFLTIILLLNLLIWIGFTHLQGRFFVLAIPITAMLAGLVEMPAWTIVVTAASVVGGAIGCLNLMPRVMRFSPVLGLEDYRPLLPENASRLLDTDRTIILAGDARAFRYPIPMSRLRYRTVFDVNAKDGQTGIDAWVGDHPPAGATILVDPAELRRLAGTYWKIPGPATDATEPFVIDPVTAK